MSEEKNKPTFPIHPGIAMTDIDYLGISKREYAAIMAMQGMLANPSLYELTLKALDSEEACTFLNKAAIEQADDLFKQLAKATE